MNSDEQTLDEICEELPSYIDEEAFRAYAEYHGVEYATVESFEEQYQGTHDSEEAFAESYAEEMGLLSEIPENLRYYFDFEKFARDMFISDLYTIDTGYGSVYVFRSY